MGQADKYLGLMKRIQFERFQNTYSAITTAITSGTTKVVLDCAAYTGPSLPKGGKITLTKPFSYTSQVFTLDSELVTGATTISVESVAVNADYPIGSAIVCDNTTLVADRYRRYFTVHLNANFQMTTSTTLNDHLGTLSQGTFTSDGGSVFADQDNKGNNFGGRYGMLNAIGTDFKIHEIKTNFITNILRTNITLSFWKKSFDPTGTSNSKINLVCQNTATGAGSYNQGYQFHNTRLETTTNGQFGNNDVLIPSIRQDQPAGATYQAYFDVQVVCSALFN